MFQTFNALDSIADSVHHALGACYRCADIAAAPPPLPTALHCACAPTYPVCVPRLYVYPHIVQLKSQCTLCFVSAALCSPLITNRVPPPCLCRQKDEVYLNLVLEYIPETVYKVSRHYNRSRQTIPISFIKVGRGRPSPASRSVTVLEACRQPESAVGHARAA